MNVDTLFQELVQQERQLEEMREAATTMSPHVLPEAASSRSGTHEQAADRRNLARHLRSLETGLTKAARAARDARRLLRPYATPTVTEDEDAEPGRGIEP